MLNNIQIFFVCYETLYYLWSIINKKDIAMTTTTNLRLAALEVEKRLNKTNDLSVISYVCDKYRVNVNVICAYLKINYHDARLSNYCNSVP